MLPRAAVASEYPPRSISPFNLPGGSGLWKLVGACPGWATSKRVQGPVGNRRFSKGLWALASWAASKRVHSPVRSGSFHSPSFVELAVSDDFWVGVR